MVRDLIEELVAVFWENQPWATIVPLLILSLCLVGWLAIKSEMRETEAWERYKVEHKCKVVGYVKGGVSVGYTSAGKGGTVIVPEADKTTWLCDDGMTYTR